MKERISLLAKGKIEQPIPQIRLEPERLEETIPQGMRQHRELWLRATNKVAIRGLIYVSGKHILLKASQMAGYRCCVEFDIAADEVKPGTVLEGKFHFITNGAEFSVPYRYVVEEALWDQENNKKLQFVEEEPADYEEEEKMPQEAEEAPQAKYSLEAHCMEMLADYESGRFSPQLIVPSLETELKIWKKNDPGSLWPDLFRAYIMIGRNRKADAIHLLEDMYDAVMSQRAAKIEAYSYYLYLRYLLTAQEEQKDAIRKIVAKFYQDWARKPIIYLILLRIEEALMMDPGEVLKELQSLGQDGEASSFLLLEACQVYAKEPACLTELSEYQEKVLAFGLERKMITRELAFRIGAAAERKKHYSEATAGLLFSLYELYPEQEVLTGLISLCIKGNRYEERMVPYYEKAIAQAVRVTGLYEAYLASLPENFTGNLPEELILYFSFKHELTDELHEVLHHHIVRCHKPGSRVYKAYQEQMEQFAIRQLLQGKISSHLAPIYRHMLSAEMIDDRIAGLLPDLLFAKEIICENSKMVRAVIKYPEKVHEVVMPLKNGRVCVPIYTDDAVITFMDPKGRVVSGKYVLVPLMENEQMLARCKEMAGEGEAFRFLNCLEAMKKSRLKDSDWSALYEAFRDVSYEEDFRRLIAGKLLNQSNAFTAEPEYEQFLYEIDIAGQPRKDIVRYEEILIQREKFETAMDAIRRFGFTGLKAGSLDVLAHQMILLYNGKKEEQLMSICMSLYRRDKADEILLEYICRYYNGITTEMCQILKDAVAKKVNLHDFAERVLAQMMFTGQYDELDMVFAAYASADEVMKMLVQAYFSIKCYQYFVKKQPVPGYIFNYMEDFLNGGQCHEEAFVLTGAAMLQYYSQQESLEEEQKELAQSIVDALLERKKYFASFLKLSPYVKLPVRFNGKTILEYHGERDKEIYLRSMFAPEEMEKTSYRMEQMCDGVYVRSLTLFEGEWLVYDISRNGEEGEKVLVSEKVLYPNPEYRIPGSRFDDICRASGKDMTKRDQILKDMEKKDMMIQWLFPLD